MRDPLDFPPPDVLEQVTLNRIRIAARKRITGADVYRSLKMSVQSDPQPFYDAAEDLVMQIVGEVYKEDLPPEEIKHSTEVELNGTEIARFEVPATWWQHWKEATAGRWWRRLVWWLRPVRYYEHQTTVPWSGTRRVTCTVDLRRFYVYPESQFGERLPSVVGPIVVPKHQITAFWTDQEVPG